MFTVYARHDSHTKKKPKFLFYIHEHQRHIIYSVNQFAGGEMRAIKQ